MYGTRDIVVGYNRRREAPVGIGIRNNQTIVHVSYGRNDVSDIMKKVVGDSKCIARIADSGRLFRPIRVGVFSDTLKLMNNF